MYHLKINCMNEIEIMEFYGISEESFIEWWELQYSQG